MKTRSVLITLAAVAVLAVGISFFISEGFRKRTDVCLQKYSISEDGSVMTVQTSLAGSMGFIRAIETERDGGAVYCSFYCAFGGLNSGIGAKSRFDIPLAPSSARIYFDRGQEGYVLVLQKDEATGAWTDMQGK